MALVQDRANAEQLRLALEPVLSTGERRVEIVQAACALGKPDAAVRLVEVLLSVALGESRRA